MEMQGVKDQKKTGRCKSYALMLCKVGDIFFLVPSLPPKHKCDLLCRCNSHGNLFKNERLHFQREENIASLYYRPIIIFSAVGT